MKKKKKELPKFDVTKEIPEMFSYGKSYGNLMLGGWIVYGIVVFVKLFKVFVGEIL